ncbi:Unknown protein [Striga hermonthica]|uniref:C2 NT-type domain-containing protein n=1 Tax=Striga hermonthica TaxID=68872 RepID=A0A9N7RBN5_STRHE|nr:Unknown protein [Striga hermonthica]
MSSKVESTAREDEDLSCGLLLRDIEEISKALYLHQAPPHKPFNSSHECGTSISAKTGVLVPKPCVPIESSSNKDKKTSLWKWKPLKALANIRNNRFNCCFFLHVHAVEGLPPNFDDLSLCVIWTRKNDSSRTRPARACSGMAEFEETLMHRCTIYGSRSGPGGSVKYKPKIFSLGVDVVGPTELNLGNHWIDLSRLLPITVEALEGDKGCSGQWTTSFKLTGEAKGAILNVSFGFSVLGGNSFEPGYFVKVPDIGGRNNHFAEFDKESELSHSVTLLYQKLDKKKMGCMIDFDHSRDSEFSETISFDVIEQGIEISKEDKMELEKCVNQEFDNTLIETINVSDIFYDEETAFDECVKSNSNLADNHEEQEYVKEPAFEESCTSLYDMLPSKSLINLDDVSELIENDFLDMLNIDQSQDGECPDDFDQSFTTQPVKNEHNTVNGSSLRTRRDAKVLENLETEALMHEWGLSETAFLNSPHINSGGFGSPIYIPAEEPLKLPPIEDGVGSMVRTRDGGYLRSMNPLIFANANNGARLIVQVSAPVVLPPEMGFTVMEILQCWASGGYEKMCIQVNELMPLEDVTGKTIREVLSEEESGSGVLNRYAISGVLVV